MVLRSVGALIPPVHRRTLKPPAVVQRASLLPSNVRFVVNCYWMTHASTSTPTSTASPPPCQREASTWRECLKRKEYSPDLELNECTAPRNQYYGCINAWRQADAAVKGLPAPSAKSFYGPAACADHNDMLLRCMQIYMFEVANCKKEMDELKLCVTTHDPNARSFAPNLENSKAGDKGPQNGGGLRGVWNRITGASA